MDLDEMTTKLNERQAWVAGKRVKLDFGGKGGVLLDGVDQKVERDGAGDADTTIKVDWADWQQMANGQLDGMTAFMSGKLKIEGDMSNAMQLQSVLGRLQG